MDPMKPVDNRPNRIIQEERTIQYTEWKIHDDILRYCFKCRDSYGVLQKRFVTGRDGDRHSEYRIICQNCGQKSGTHISKNLTIFDWDGHQEDKDSLRFYRRSSK